MEFPLFVLLPFPSNTTIVLRIEIPILHTKYISEHTRLVISLSQVVPVPVVTAGMRDMNWM